MILCLCKGVSDRKVVELVKQGQTLEQIVDTCRAGTGCGACAMDLREIVRSETANEKSRMVALNTCS
jgi:bacterioferritin-associated ferredoxin